MEDSSLVMPVEIAGGVDRFCERTGTDRSELVVWNLGDYGVYVCTTEKFFKSLNFQVSDPRKVFTAASERREDPHASLQWRPRDSRRMTSVIYDWYRDNAMQLAVLDIGAYVGRFSIETALWMKSSGNDLPLFAFEPGLTVPLVEANAHMNAVESKIKLTTKAVSNAPGKQTYRLKKGSMISGRLSELKGEHETFEVESVRGVDFLESHGIDTPLFVKIDTEGLEAKVIDGLVPYSAFRQSTLIIELWPGYLEHKMSSGVRFADMVNADYVVLDIRSSLYPCYHQVVTDLRAYTKAIDFSKRNVDVLLIPKSVPGSQDLLQALKQALPAD